MSGHRTQRFAFAWIWAAAGVTIGLLALIIGVIVLRGLPSISWQFLTGTPENLGREGGILRSWARSRLGWSRC
jgi:phosphate transport system permease protein